MTKTFATQALALSLLMSAPSWLFGQATVAPGQFKSRTGPAANNATGKQPSEFAPASPNEFETITAPPTAGSATVKRSSNTRYVSAREDVPPVVVQFSGDNDTMDLLQEDLAIMGLQIRKAIEGTSDQDVLTKPEKLLRATGSPSVRTMYLDGFGVVVFLKVGFPLLGSAAPPPAAPEPADTEWNRAKQDLLAEKRRALTTDFIAGQPYDADQVETLKTQVCTALKDATNIRSIKQGDFIAVTAFGPPSALGGKPGVSEMRGTVLTIRVKKSDIDAYAANKLDLDKFKEKAAIAAYSGTGYGLTSINSWAKSGGLPVR